VKIAQNVQRTFDVVHGEWTRERTGRLHG
jgi:hypothetical protein